MTSNYTLHVQDLIYKTVHLREWTSNSPPKCRRQNPLWLEIQKQGYQWSQNITCEFVHPPKKFLKTPLKSYVWAWLVVGFLKYFNPIIHHGKFPDRIWVTFTMETFVLTFLGSMDRCLFLGLLGLNNLGKILLHYIFLKTNSITVRNDDGFLISDLSKNTFDGLA